MRKKLGQFCEVQGGYAFKSDDYKNEGVPLLRISNIVDSRVEFLSDSVYLPSSYLDKYKEFIVKRDDIVIALSGATTGKFGIYDKSEPALLNQRVGRIKINNIQEVCNSYLYHFFETIKDKIFKKAYGVAQPNISPKDISDFEISLPNIKEQKRIATILDKADAIRKKRQESIRLLDEFLQSVFLEMFGDPVRNEKGWAKKIIGEITRVETGSTPNRDKKEYYENGTIPWIKTSEVNGKYITDCEEYITEEALNKTNCKVFSEHTVLLAMYGQGQTRGRVGYLKLKSATNQACAAILPNDTIDTLFLFNQLKLRYQELRNLGRGGNQPNLNLSIIKNFEIIYPGYKIQRRFSQIVEKTEQQKQLLERSLIETEYCFNSLMQKAFRGEL